MREILHWYYKNAFNIVQNALILQLLGWGFAHQTLQWGMCPLH